MKTLIPSTIATLFVCLFLFTGCGPSTVPTPSASETFPVTETPISTLAPTATATLTPTQAPSPTVTPLPLPCNIAFDSDRDGNREIYGMDPDGNNQVNLTNDPADDFNPAWSPDGSQIAFVSTRPNEVASRQAIYIMDANGGNVFQLTTNFYSEWPTWSPDGKQIVFAGNGDIHVITADQSGQPVNLTNSPEKDTQPAWSPDGSKIAWLSGDGQNLNIFVMNSDGSNLLKLTDNGKAHSVLWTMDGKIISDWDHPDGVCIKCVMGADGSNVRSAGGKGEVQHYLPFKTSDGDRVECISGDFHAGNEEIYLVGEIYPDIFFNLTNNPGMDRNPDWPVNCLSGFEGGGSEESAVSETGPTDLQNELLLGYAGDDPSQWQRKGNFQKACDELGIQCVYGAIPALLNKNVSAIVLNSGPEKIERSASAIREAVEKGIPVFVLDAEIDMNGVYTITADHSEMIRRTLNTLFMESGGSGEFAYFDFDPSQKDTELIKRLLEKEYPGVRVVTSDAKTYNFREEKSSIQDLLSRYPDLRAIWTNAGHTNAIFGIVESINDPEKYPMLTCDPTKGGFHIWKDRIPEYPGFKCMAVSNPPGIAYDAVYGAYYLLSGEKMDESAPGGKYGNAFVVDFPVITNDNLLKELEIINYEDDKFFADQLMTPEEIKDRWFLD